MAFGRVPCRASVVVSTFAISQFSRSIQLGAAIRA
jgi:hypothetical protein